MDLYVVLDTKGDGRVLGVFDALELARELVAQSPSYYKLHRCRLNQVNPEVLQWIDDRAQREAVERIIERAGAGAGERPAPRTGTSAREGKTTRKRGRH